MNKKMYAYRSLLIGVLLTVSLAAAGPSYAHGQILTLDVKPDGSTFSMVPDPGAMLNGPFFISGPIFAPGTTTMEKLLRTAVLQDTPLP